MYRNEKVLSSEIDIITYIYFIWLGIVLWVI